MELFFTMFTNCLYRVRLDFPTVEVRFENVNVEAQVYVGSRALPSILNFFGNVLEVINSGINSRLILVCILFV